MIDGRYEPVEILGTGGMATVWKAKDTVLDRWVAVKRLLPHLANDPDISERFEREARASARLNHPGIVAIYDSGVDDSGAFIVLEYVEGESLAERLAREGRLDPGTAAGIVAQVAAALDYAHETGIVHRDVKPSNLILAKDGTVQLADFGIARSLNQPATLTQPGDLVGTLAYLSPEVIAGDTITESSDIYSLGAVTYEMLAGRPPFEAPNVGALMDAIRSGGIPPDPGVPDEMLSRISEAMSLDPGRRPATAGAFASSLLASTTLVLNPDATVYERSTAPAGAASEDPTLVMSGGELTPRSNRSRRTRLGASLLALAALLASAYAIASNQSGSVLGAETSAPGAAVTTSTVATLSTTTSTSTSSTTTTTMPGPAALADEIRVHLEDLEPPEFKRKEVEDLFDRLQKVMEAWNRGEDNLDKKLEELLAKVEDLPESPEREHLREHVLELAGAMGIELDDEDDD